MVVMLAVRMLTAIADARKYCRLARMTHLLRRPFMSLLSEVKQPMSPMEPAATTLVLSAVA